MDDIHGQIAAHGMALTDPIHLHGRPFHDLAHGKMVGMAAAGDLAQMIVTKQRVDYT